MRTKLTLAALLLAGATFSCWGVAIPLPPVQGPSGGIGGGGMLGLVFQPAVDPVTGMEYVNGMESRGSSGDKQSAVTRTAEPFGSRPSGGGGR